MDGPIGIIGAGAWGTALAQVLAHSEQDVMMWSPEKDVASSINKSRENKKYLPNIPLCERITVVTKLDKVAKKCKVFFVCCPASANTEVATSLQPYLTSESIVVLCSKGFRESDGAILTDVWQEVLPNFHNLVVLSGPSLAGEVAQKKLTAVVLASKKEALVHKINALFKVSWFRPYFSDDIIGLQVAAAVKNVIAIAAGMSDALELGENARAAIVCRGLAEISRYGKCLGADPETFIGLAGLGDVMVTAFSKLSRNYRLGYYIGQGMPPEEAYQKIGAVVEGYRTARIVTEQSVCRGIDLGVVMVMDGVLQGDIKPSRAIELLASRPRINEFEERIAL